MNDFVVPPALDRGDRVAVVAPGSNRATEYPHVYELGLKRLREVFDLEPVEFPTATKDTDYLYDHSEERARDVMDAFADPEISGVVTVIGGFEQVRILKHLDPEVLRENPTRFYGISDNTNLACYLWNLGVVSFYGGTVMTDLAMQGSMHDYTVEYLETAFFAEDLDAFGEIRPADEFTDEDLDWADPDNLDRHRETEPSPGRTWRGGDRAVSGRTWGGCVSTLDMQLRTDRYLPPAEDLDGRILLLETSEELPSAMDVRQFLIGMGERGLLERFAGVLVGRAKARSLFEDPGPEGRADYREDQRETIADVLAEYNPDAPVVFDAEFGHTAPIAPIPVGGHVELDPTDETVTVGG
ncbi:S66 peptidase family protein [Halorussus sp. MSC15.2]|uniref:S66 family peptidase n=1 Tax=Halorussus sp. MSC15.2 TaxID=2283638 RepID=UPI0013D71065|nr:S66 peptidase family protein [Halorussus sp. MSC15.2]NEU58376.1 LD-carboxypeptidase [Halorussus sp. MSC15.2]